MKEQDRQHAIRLRLARSDAGRAGVLPTGFAALDAALSSGFPRGFIVELFGPSSSGKTTLMLQIVADLQERGATAAWIDAEHAFDAPYAAGLGVRLENMPLAQPESAEQAMEIICRLAETGAVDLLIVDSAAALVPRLELESGVGDSGAGLQSRVMASALRKLARLLQKNGAVVVFLNQVRSRRHTDGADAETTAGGAPLKLHAAVRLALRSGPEGRISFRILKNKVAGAFRDGELRREPGGEFTKSP